MSRARGSHPSHHRAVRDHWPVTPLAAAASKGQGAGDAVVVIDGLIGLLVWELEGTTCEVLATACRVRNAGVGELLMRAVHDLATNAMSDHGGEPCSVGGVVVCEVRR